MKTHDAHNPTVASSFPSFIIEDQVARTCPERAEGALARRFDVDFDFPLTTED